MYEPIIFSAKVEVNAILQPPLNGIVENFMVKHAKYDIDFYVKHLKEYIGKIQSKRLNSHIID